jgi:CRP-like cAMP-binding protein
MFESLFNYINNYTLTPLSKSEFELIKTAFTPKKLRKRQYFLQEGEVCKYFAFIVKGAMRQYTIDDKGMEHFVQLAIENWWVGDRESWVMLTPSAYIIDAWEDTDILVLKRANLLELLQQIPVMNEMVKSMDEKHAIATQKRLTGSISLSAEKRYEDFVNRYPDLLQRFPQHIIASYLGIAKETLSRIRHQAAKK